MKIKEKILTLFESQKDLTIKEITDSLLVSKQALHLAMNQLIKNSQVIKLGRTPKTIYRLNSIKIKEAENYENISDKNIQ
jgi:predicted ArsR family transcriptional regulator